MFKQVLWIVSLALIAGQAVSQELYRYVDKDGTTILNSSIPSEYVNSGYEVINAQGQVVQVVPRKDTSSSELDLVVEKSDTILMSSYSAATEIEAHRDRKLDSIEREVDNIESDRRVLGLQLAEEIAERDSLLRLLENTGLNDRQVDRLEHLKSNIEHLAEMSLKLQAQLQRRSHDVVGIKNEYALKIERFVQLQQSGIDVRQTSLQNTDQR